MADERTYRVRATLNAEIEVEAGSGYEAERKARAHFQLLEDQEAKKADYEDVGFQLAGIESRTPLG